MKIAAMTLAQKMTVRERGRVIGAVVWMRYPRPCEHGHFGCSNREHGACSADRIESAPDAGHSMGSVATRAVRLGTGRQSRPEGMTE